jgi:hypothetical protein
MKHILLATALVATTATSAAAIDLGNGLALNTTVDLEYSTDTELFTTLVTPKLSYSPMESLAIWAESELTVYNGTDLQINKDAFPGVTLGVDYSLPAMGTLAPKAYLESTFDSDFNYDSTLIGISLSF